MLRFSVAARLHPTRWLAGGPSIRIGHDERSTNGTYALAKYGQRDVTALTVCQHLL